MNYRLLIAARASGKMTIQFALKMVELAVIVVLAWFAMDIVRDHFGRDTAWIVGGIAIAALFAVLFNQNSGSR